MEDGERGGSEEGGRQAAGPAFIASPGMPPGSAAMDTAAIPGTLH